MLRISLLINIILILAAGQLVYDNEEGVVGEGLHLTRTMQGTDSLVCVSVCEYSSVFLSVCECVNAYVDECVLECVCVYECVFE